MAQCEVCGNDYDKAFQIRHGNTTHTFDCFECAVEALAPRCHHCGCKIIGHGVESDSRMYCCAHCASMEGVTALRDRVDEVTADGPAATPVPSRRWVQ